MLQVSMSDASPLESLGPYVLIEPLARGGMGELYRARKQGADGPDVVLKCVRPRSTDRADRFNVRGLLDEARIATLLNHPNIVEVYEVDYQDGYYYMVMEWLDGWDLRTICARLDQVDELLPIPTILRWGAETCRGLHAAHECTTERGEPLNLVHRDIDHANLFVTRRGNIKVLDFGVAKSSIQVWQTTVGILKGKFSYMSPEQCRGKPLDRRSDIFSLGVVLHELITGKRLFKRDTPRAAMTAIQDGFVPPPSRPDEPIPDELVATVMRALQRDRTMRFPTAEDLRHELETAATHTGRPALPELESYLKELFDPAKAPMTDDVSTTVSLHLGDWADAVSEQLGTTTQVDVKNTTRLPFWRDRRWMVGLAALSVLVIAVASWWLAPSDSADTGRPVTEGVVSEDATPEHLAIPDPAQEKAQARPRKAARAKASRNPSRKPPPTKRIAQHGRLTLQAKPWANVYLGKRLLGSTPLLGLKLPAGEVTLRLVNPDTNWQRSVTVTIVANELVKTIVDLHP